MSLSDELLGEIQQQMNLVQAGSISEQVEYFLKPWIEEVESLKKEEEIEKEGIMSSQGVKLEKYVYVRGGSNFRLFYSMKDGGTPKILSKQNKNVEKLNELSRRMQQCNWDRQEWRKNLEELFPPCPSPPLPVQNLKNIYSKGRNYEVRVEKNAKKVRCIVYSLDDAIMVRDFLRAQPNFDELIEKKKEVNRGEFSKYVLELAKKGED